MTRHRRQAIAPGRVNLIGEHIDYNGLPVLPMALDRSVRIDFTPLDEPVVRLASTAPGCEPVEFRLDRPIERAPQGHWSNYVRAAAWGLLHPEAQQTKGAQPTKGARRTTGEPASFAHNPPSTRTGRLRGFEGQVNSDLPIASGLASSSALVVATGLALLNSNDVPLQGDDASLRQLALADIMAQAERFTGVQGGGMDQAACLRGVAGHAIRIDFDPLRATPVPIPTGWRWIVASSLARAEKSREAMDAYNTRAQECRQALDLLWLHTDTTAARPHKRISPPTYLHLIRAFSTDELLDQAARILGPKLLSRFRHVVTEGRRVEEAQRAMAEARLAEFGALMVQSHESLRDDYEVSTPALDEIVLVALDAGAAGARLTGAGFGGCAVILCDEDSAPAVEDAMLARFYAPRVAVTPVASQPVAVSKPVITANPAAQHMFFANPATGARVVTLPPAPAP